MKSPWSHLVTGSMEQEKLSKGLRPCRQATIFDSARSLSYAGKLPDARTIVEKRAVYYHKHLKF